MLGFWILCMTNALCGFALIEQLRLSKRVVDTLDIFRKSGVAINWSQVFPCIKRFRPWVRWLFFYTKELDKTCLSKEDKLVFHILWTFLMPLMCLIGYFKGLINGFLCLVLCGGIYFWKQLILSGHTKKRTQIFNKNAYRLYMFLHNQLSAGIQPKDCVLSLHKVVSEPVLQERLKAFGSLYVQTLDFDMAFSEIGDYYEGSDVDAFKIAMEQGLMIGENLDSLKKQEALMFSKYMNFLQLETERQKLKTLIVVTLFCVIIIFMIGLPLAMELDQAIELIFV